MKLHQLWSYSVRHNFLEVIWSTSIIFLAPLCEPTPARLCNWSGTKSIQFSCKSLSVDDKSTSSAKRSGHTCQAQILDQMVENHIWAVHVSRFSLMGQASQPVTKWECCYDCFTFTPFAETFSGISTMRPFSIAANQYVTWQSKFWNPPRPTALEHHKRHHTHSTTNTISVP